MINKIFLEDCFTTLVNRKCNYDYVFTVPPDYDELNLDPVKDHQKYLDFLNSIFSLLVPRKNIVTIAITDRKYGGKILTKHINIVSFFESLGYKYISQKIWCKSYKINLYRLNYSFVMSFAKNKYRQKGVKSYLADVWHSHVYSHLKFKYAIALEIVKHCISNFTEENDIVYDPFMGSGTTAIACLGLNRQYLGSEISESHYNIAEDRIKKYHLNKKNA